MILLKIFLLGIFKFNKYRLVSIKTQNGSLLWGIMTEKDSKILIKKGLL